MEVYQITGGTPLYGTVEIQGSKNAVLPMIAASVLTEEKVRLKRCPDISDVHDMTAIIKSLGGKVWWEGQDLCLENKNLSGSTIQRIFSERMRSSILFLGSLLGRTKQARVYPPGGCRIGKRPTDLHQKALSALGAEVQEKNGILYAKAEHPNGNFFRFPKVSVGATENAILFAAGMEETTLLEGCAKEPEIWHLCQMLRQMGVEIEGEKTGRIRIKGKKKRRGCSMEIPPDRIVAGTFLFAGAATGGVLKLSRAPAEEMKAVLRTYQKMGGQYTWEGGTLVADSRKVNRAVPYLETKPYSGFPTDLQSLYAAAAVTLQGESRILETIFENRMQTAAELQKMGADVKWEGNELFTRKSLLKGTEVTAFDLRGGAALTVAALAAKGRSVIKNIHLIERGYENFPEKLTMLGAKIQKQQVCGRKDMGDTAYETAETQKKE